MWYILCFYFVYIMLQKVIQESFKWCLHWSQYLHGTDYLYTFVPSIYYITTGTVYKFSKCHLKTSMSMGIFVRCEWFLIPAPRNPCYDTNWEVWSIPSLGLLIFIQCQYQPRIATLKLNMIIKLFHSWGKRLFTKITYCIMMVYVLWHKLRVLL